MGIMLVINWTNALVVTLLGFSLVFCLLVLLVFVLKLFGVIMEPKKVRRDEPLDEVSNSKIVGGATEEEQAVIALALQMFYDDSCKEGGALTLKAKPTAWNSKIYGINNLEK